MTSIEWKLRRRTALRDKLSAALIEMEGGLRSGTLITAMDAAVSLERIEAMYRPILKLDEDILGDITDERVAEETSNTTAYNDKVVKIRAELQHRSRGQQAGESLVSPSLTRPPPNETATTRTKLPAIELTKFDGDRRNWIRFWSLFESAVHNNTELRATEKFYYLTSLLTSSAAASVSGLPMTEQCYNDAIEILQKRFADQTRIAQDHLRALIDIRAVSSSSDVAQLRKLYDEVQIHCRSLNALGTSPETYCVMLREILLRALPRDMVLRYHRHSKTSSTALSSTGVGRQHQLTDHKKQFDDLINFFGVELE